MCRYNRLLKYQQHKELVGAGALQRLYKIRLISLNNTPEYKMWLRCIAYSALMNLDGDLLRPSIGESTHYIKEESPLSF